MITTKRFNLFSAYQTMQNTVLQTVKVQRKVEAARMFSTWSQAPAKVRVVSDISPVITVAHFSMQPHLQWLIKTHILNFLKTVMNSALRTALHTSLHTALLIVLHTSLHTALHTALLTPLLTALCTALHTAIHTVLHTALITVMHTKPCNAQCTAHLTWYCSMWTVLHLCTIYFSCHRGGGDYLVWSLQTEYAGRPQWNLTLNSLILCCTFARLWFLWKINLATWMKTLVKQTNKQWNHNLQKKKRKNHNYRNKKTNKLYIL